MTAQGRLATLNLAHCSKLESVFIGSCGGLRRLMGVRELASLLELGIGGTDLNFDELEKAGFPASLKVLRFYSKYHREDPTLRRRLDEKGFFPRRYCEYPRKPTAARA